MRRLLSVAVLAALVSTSAACSSSNNTTPTTGVPTSAAVTTSPTPTVDVAANTKQVCDKAKAILTEDKVKPIGVQIGTMIAARQAKNKAAETAAMTQAKTLADALAQEVRDLKSQAVDTKLQAALDKAADGLALFGSPDYLSKINSTADMTKLTDDITAAGQDLETVCGG